MKGLVFTYLMTYGGSLVALFKPFVGLQIYICFAIIKPESLWFWSVPPGNYSRTVAIALLIGWVLGGCGNWALGRGRSIVICLLGYFLWATLSAVQAPDQEVAWKYVEDMAKIVLPFLVGITTINSTKQIMQLAWVIVLSHGYLAFEFNMSYFEGFNVVRDIGFGGLLGGSVAISMVTCMGLAFFLGLHAGKWWLKALALGSALLMGHVILFSFSRGGLLALIITAAVAFFLIPKKPQHYLVFLLAVLLGLRLAGPEVRERFMTSFADEADRDPSAQSRIYLWSNCLDAMQKRPLLGLGPYHFHLIAQEYGWPAGKEAHSTWLQTGAELGLPGLAFLLLFYLICMKELLPFLRRGYPVRDERFRFISRMVITSIVGFLSSSQFVTLVGLEVPYYVVLLAAAMLKLQSVLPVEATAQLSAAGYTQTAATAAAMKQGSCGDSSIK